MPGFCGWLFPWLGFFLVKGKGRKGQDREGGKVWAGLGRVGTGQAGTLLERVSVWLHPIFLLD